MTSLQKYFWQYLKKKPCTSWNKSYYIETQDFLLVLFFDAFFAKSCPSVRWRETNGFFFPAGKPFVGEQEQRRRGEARRLWSCHWSPRRPTSLVWWVKSMSMINMNWNHFHFLLRFCWHPWLPLPGGAEKGTVWEACWYLGMWWVSTSPWAKTKTKTDTKIIWEAWWYLGVWCTSTHPWWREHF